MGKKSININEQILTQYSSSGDLRVLWLYALAVVHTAGKGYIGVDDFKKRLSQFSNKSEKTIERWIDSLIFHKLIKIKKQVIYPISREKFEASFPEANQIYIRYEEEDLKAYHIFRKHTIQQVALLKQRRYKYAYRKHMSKADIASLVKCGTIETELAALRGSKQAGCSISQLVKTLGFDKKTISESLKGVTQKQVNFTLPIKGSIARMKYGSLLNNITSNQKNQYDSMSYKMVFDYNSKKDTYRIGCKLASRILVTSSISRLRFK